jgi:hypothetical protein
MRGSIRELASLREEMRWARPKYLRQVSKEGGIMLRLATIEQEGVGFPVRSGYRDPDTIA